MRMMANVTLTNVEAVRQARDDVNEKIKGLYRAMRALESAINSIDVEVGQSADAAAD